jgi:hypothetical protein
VTCLDSLHDLILASRVSPAQTSTLPPGLPSINDSAVCKALVAPRSEEPRSIVVQTAGRSQTAAIRLALSRSRWGAVVDANNRPSTREASMPEMQSWAAVAARVRESSSKRTHRFCPPGEEICQARAISSRDTEYAGSRTACPTIPFMIASQFPKSSLVSYGTSFVSNPPESISVRRRLSSSALGSGVSGTEEGTMRSNPVLATTCSTVVPGCTDCKRMRRVSGQKSRTARLVTINSGPRLSSIPSSRRLFGPEP